MFHRAPNAATNIIAATTTNIQRKRRFGVVSYCNCFRPISSKTLYLVAIIICIQVPSPCMHTTSLSTTKNLDLLHVSLMNALPSLRALSFTSSSRNIQGSHVCDYISVRDAFLRSISIVSCSDLHVGLNTLCKRFHCIRLHLPLRYNDFFRRPQQGLHNIGIHQSQNRSKGYRMSGMYRCY